MVQVFHTCKHHIFLFVLFLLFHLFIYFFADFNWLKTQINKDTKGAIESAVIYFKKRDWLYLHGM